MHRKKVKILPYTDERHYNATVQNGAVALPTEVLHYLDVREGSPLHIIVDVRLGLVKLQKSQLCCAICGRGGELGVAGGCLLCRSCVESILTCPPFRYTTT